MFKKLALLAAVALAIPLSAQVFELKFDEKGKDNWAGFNNYYNRNTRAVKPVAGAKYASVALGKDLSKSKSKDTSFLFKTPKFSVAGKTAILIEGSTYSTLNVSGIKRQGCYVTWYAKDAKTKIPVTYYTITWKKGAFSDFKAEVKVPANAAFAVVGIGFDQPNFLDKDMFAVKSFKVNVK